MKDWQGGMYDIHNTFIFANQIFRTIRLYDSVNVNSSLS